MQNTFTYSPKTPKTSHLIIASGLGFRSRIASSKSSSGVNKIFQVLFLWYSSLTEVPLDLKTCELKRQEYLSSIHPAYTGYRSIRWLQYSCSKRYDAHSNLGPEQLWNLCKHIFLVSGLGPSLLSVSFFLQLLAPYSKSSFFFYSKWPMIATWISFLACFLQKKSRSPKPFCILHCFCSF